MKLDPIPFMVECILATPGFPEGITVSADLDMHPPGSRHIDVVLEGGGRVIRDRLDRWDFTLNHYAASKRLAMESALMVREWLLESVAGLAFGNVAVANVVEETAPFDQGDIDSREQRIIHRVSVYLYEI